MSPASEAAGVIARTLRSQAVGRSFGHIRFWQTAASRPGGPAWTLVSVWARGDRLGLVLVPASRDGEAVILEVEAPSGLRLEDGGLCLEDAVGMRFGSLFAARQGEHYLVLRGEREERWPRQGHPALSLSPGAEPTSSTAPS